jgi:hypothetical protein
MLVRNVSSMVLAAALALGAPAAALADSAPVAAQIEPTAPARTGTTTETKDYAQREAKDKAVADFKGGSTVVIAMSGGTILVLVLLLLLL